MNPGLGPAEQLLLMWRAALAASQPAACCPGHWPAPPPGRLAVIACGKAAMGMAAEAAAHFGDNCEGIVIFPRGLDERTLCRRFEYYPASHPLPDQHSVIAAQAALDLAGELGDDDLLLVLLSGGGSSLMCLPANGVTLEEKQAVSRQLLACGATIQEINCVRKQLSAIKGGRLAQASRAAVVTLAISDVPGDDPALIASGPTVADPATPDQARAVLARHGIDVNESIEAALGRRSRRAPRPPRDAGRDRYDVIASGMTALRAAAEWCRKHHIEAVMLGDELQGEARELARMHATLARERSLAGRAVCILSGGESTVSLSAEPGRGGRNTVYALELARALAGHPGIWALAADTDGIDGRGGHSGAAVDPGSLGRADSMGLDAGAFLANNDSATFFESVGGLLTEGPTGTNVNDFRAILINPQSRIRSELRRPGQRAPG
jgi:hydroxypyruvate reductase